MFLFGIERGIGDERCKWQLEKEWMVTPPALMAAIPVGATMTVRLGDSFFRLCRKVVFRFLLSGEEEMGASILYYLPGTL